VANILILKRSFYDRPTLDVASELLGKHLVVMWRKKRLSGRIVEVEAYIGENDPASHAAPGLTKRNAIMFGPPGFSYVYFIYGMYNCLNVVTEHKGFPAAILIRAAEPCDGVEEMIKHSPRTPHSLLLSGPGRLCRSLGLTTKHSGLDLMGEKIWIEDHGEGPNDIVSTPRIGIRKAVDWNWRFICASSPAISGPRLKSASGAAARK
jgi:DNA-3-methyladenine glycosylase